MLLAPSFVPAGGTSLIVELRNLGLTTGLQVCLDVGDLNSYSGTGQTWNDLSGNGNHFYLGSGSGSDSADPTFNGVAGRKTTSDYFSYDGGDRFTLAQSAPSWQSGMHKAGGKFTILQWAYVSNLTGLAPSQAGFGCGDNTSSSDGRDAITFSNSGSRQNALSIAVQSGTSAVVVGAVSTLLLTNNAWQMIATALDIDAKTIVYAVNGSTESPANVGSASPSSTNSHVPLVIGDDAAGGDAAAITGCRIASTAIWTSNLNETQLKSIFGATRGRFGV